jgi:predicted peptidase
MRVGLLVAVLIGLLLSAGGAASAQSRPANPPVRADVITEVLPTGARVVAVAIKYSRALSSRAPFDSSAFDVTATIKGVTAPRTVLDVYPNTSAQVDATGHDGRSGRYLIVELDPNDDNAAAQEYTEETWTVPFPLVGAYSIRQTADIVDSSGQVILPASPFAIANDGVINRIVDDFVPMSFTDSAGTTLKFRLFVPRRYRNHPNDGQSYPLVTFLHGSGETGDSNLTQLTANQGGVAFAKPERQRRDPSFVLAPQLPPPIRDFDNNNWAIPATRAAVLELIDAVAASYPVNQDRLYLTGLSMGAIGIYGILPDHPTKFAAALPIAGIDPNEDPSALTRAKGVPLWLAHSIDDPTVPYIEGSLAIANALDAAGARVTRGTWPANLDDQAAEARARQLWRQARRNHSHTLLTSYTPGTTPVSGHQSWIPTYQNDVMIDWLYSHNRAEDAHVSRRPQRSARAGLGRTMPAALGSRVAARR